MTNPDPTRRARARALGLGLDAALLVVALAAGVAMAVPADAAYRRLRGPELPQSRRGDIVRPEWFWSLHTPFDRAWFGARFVLATTTLAAAVVVLRRRGRGRRFWCRPGVVAALVAAGLGAFHTAHQAALGLDSGVNQGVWINMGNGLEGLMPGAVLGAWTALAIGGLWRRPVDGADRLGRLIGGLWLADGVVLIVYPLLWG